jgi:hypothetical protein
VSPVAIRVLRRLAVWAFLLAIALLVGPPILTEFGVLGPGVDAELDAATGALEAARTFGATEAEPHFQAAQRELERARDLAQKGHGRQARHAAIRAKALAVDAQGAALMNREEDRRRAEAISLQIDKTLNGLEDLYGEVTQGLDKRTVAGLLSEMKVGRQAGAALSLAYEQGNYAKVIHEEQETKDILELVKKKIEGARTPKAKDSPT